MKRTILNMASVLAIALVSLTLFSCTQPDNTPPSDEPTGSLTIASWLPIGTFKLSSASTEGTALEGEIEISDNNIRFSQGGALDAPNAIIVDVATLYKNFYQGDPDDRGPQGGGWYLKLSGASGYSYMTITVTAADTYQLKTGLASGGATTYTFSKTDAQN